MQQQNAAYSFHPQPLTKNYFRAVAKKQEAKIECKDTTKNVLLKGHIKKRTSRDVTFSLYFHSVGVVPVSRVKIWEKTRRDEKPQRSAMS